MRYLQDTSDMQIRDGLIQHFEFTYEISHKILKHFLEAASVNSSQFDTMSFQDLIRTANVICYCAMWDRLERISGYVYTNQPPL